MLTNKRVLIIGFDPKFLDFVARACHEPDRLRRSKSRTAAEFERSRPGLRTYF